MATQRKPKSLSKRTVWTIAGAGGLGLLGAVVALALITPGEPDSPLEPPKLLAGSPTPAPEPENTTSPPRNSRVREGDTEERPRSNGVQRPTAPKGPVEPDKKPKKGAKRDGHGRAPKSPAGVANDDIG